MIANQDLHTSPRQRIVIVLVALLMLLSTFALYASIVLSSNGSSSSAETSALTAEEEARYQELLAEYQDKVNAQASELSSKYFDEFATFKSRIKSFNAADITDVMLLGLISKLVMVRRLIAKTSLNTLLITLAGFPMRPSLIRLLMMLANRPHLTRLLLVLPR